MNKANPDYITPKIKDRITEIIEREEIHPTHHACDFTVEVAAGADLRDAIINWIRRNREGAYDSIYKQ